MRPVRFALVGYGSGGRYFHAPLLRTSATCVLVAVVSTSPERKGLAVAENPGVTLVGSLAELAALGVEAVAISTPADTHSRLTDEALERGLHVVCDKPFALDSGAAHASAELARARGLCLAPYQNRRWDSDFRTVRTLVHAGRLGSVTRLESRFERFAPDRGPKTAGGGTLLDFHSHLVDQALVLLGPVGRVYAEWRIRENGLDDEVFVALSHSSGARSHLHGSWGQSAPGSRFRVTGTVAAYVVDGPMDGQEAALVRGDTPATLGEQWGSEPPARWGTLHHDGRAQPVPSERGSWPSFYDGFAAAVRGLAALPVSADDAVRTAEVLDAARTSAMTGTVVGL